MLVNHDGRKLVDVMYVFAMRKSEVGVTVLPLPYFPVFCCPRLLSFDHICQAQLPALLSWMLLPSHHRDALIFFSCSAQMQTCRKTNHAKRCPFPPSDKDVYSTVRRSRLFANYIIFGWSLSVSHQQIREQKYVQAMEMRDRERGRKNVRVEQYIMAYGSLDPHTLVLVHQHPGKL